MKPRRTKNQFDVEALEPRLLLSGEGMLCQAAPAQLELLQDPLVPVETAPAAEGASLAVDPAEQVDDIFEGVSEEKQIVSDPAPAAPSSETDPEETVFEAANADESDETTAPPPAGSDESAVVELATFAGLGAGRHGAVNPVTQQLTDTLKAANGPPADQGINVHLTPDEPLHPGTTLVLGAEDSLTGSGTISGAVVNHGLVSPGNSPGVTNVTTFTQDADGLTLIEIGGTAGPGVNPNGWDQINVSGAASLDGTIQIALFNGFVPSLGDTFQIFTWGSATGEFANWLGTAGIPGHSDWAFQPAYSPSGLTLTVVQTPLIAGPVGPAITGGLNTLSNAANFLDDVGEFAESIPFIGSDLGALSGLGTAIQSAISDRLSSFPNPAQVTSAIESWDSTTFGGFTFGVKGVLAHYGTTSGDPVWWDVTIELSPTAVNRALENILDGVFSAAFSGSPSVSVNGKVILDFAFGYDGGAGGFFTEIDSLSAQATVDGSTIGSFGFNFNTPAGMQGLSSTGGTVALAASVTATPDASILTGGRITQATLSSLNASNIGDAFNLGHAGTLDAAFPLTGTLNFIGFTLTGGYTVRVQSDDLMSGDAPDVTLDVNSTLGIMGQTLHGDFTLKNTGTETIIEASNVNFDLDAGVTRVLSVDNGSGTFVLLGSDLAGTLSLDFALGPAIPNLSLSATNLTLALNTSSGAVPTIDGNPVNLPAGPYYRVSGNGTIGLTNPEASLTGDFVYEPRDADANTTNGYEEVAVGVANLSFNLNDGTNQLLEVANGTGAFVFRSTGIVGTLLNADVSLAVPDLEVTGVFGMALNDTNTAYNQSVNVNGTSVPVNVLAGPYLRVAASGDTTDVDTTNDHAVLTVLGIALTGDFTFEQRQTTTGGEKVVTVAASAISLDLGSIANDLINVTNGSGAFIITNDGLAGTSTASIGINVTGVTLGGTFTVRINTTDAAVNETVQVAGSPTAINVPAGPYLQVNGTGVTLGVLGATLTGDFSFEQRTSIGGQQLITVVADNVSFDFGTSILSATGGHGFFVMTDGGIAGSGQITVQVNAFGGGFSQTFDWSFNNTSGPIDQTVDWEGTPMGVDLPGGPYNKLDTGSVPVMISVPIGGYTQSITGRFILTLVEGSPDYATVAASSLSATIGSGSINLSVSDGSGAFVIYDTGIAGEVRCGSASLTGASVLGLTAMNLKLRLNNTGADVGNPDPIVVSISDNPAEDISIQFIGSYYWNYLSVAGTAEITGLTGAITLGGNFVFERGQIDTNNDTALEDVFKISGTSLHFDLNAGGFTVVSFHNGTGTFLITGNGIAGVATLEFESGVVGISGTIGLQVNTTSSPIVSASVPTAGGTQIINISETNFVQVNVSGFIHLGSVALPFDFYVKINGTAVEFRRTSDDLLLVSVSNTGAITTGLSFSDFAAPGPFEFVSMLRQFAIWIDTFRSADVFNVEIPFTNGTTLGDAFDWSQVFLDSIYSKMVSVELQSRSLALQTDSTMSGVLSNAKFKIQLGDEDPVEVVVAPNPPGPNVAYSNADHNLDELVNAFNDAIALTDLAGRVIARIHKIKDQDPSDPDYADRYVDDIFVIALTDEEVAKGTTLNLVDLDSQIAALGFGPSDGTYGDAADSSAGTATVEQVGVLVDRYDTKHFFIELGNAILGSPGTYSAAQQVYTYEVNENLHYDNQQLFGSPDIPFAWNLDLGPIAEASLSGALQFSADIGMHFVLGFDLGAREVPRLLSTSTVPVPSNGRLTQDAHFTLTLNDESPIALTLDHTLTTGNNSIEDLAADLNQVFHDYMYTGPLVTSATRLDQLIVAQKAGSGLAISALQEIDTDGDGVPDAGKDFNGDGNTDNWLGLINRLVAVSLKNDTFATEMGFGNEVVDLDGSSATTNDQVFVSVSTSSMKGLFIDKAPGEDRIVMDGEVHVQTVVNTPLDPTDIDGIHGSLRFGFVEISTNDGRFGTYAYDGVTENPLTVSLGLEDQTTGATRFYLSDLFNGTSSINIGNLLVGPDFDGSVLARLDQIGVGGLGFSFPLGPDPEISAWIPDIHDLDYNPDPYDGTNTGIFLTYPTLGSLQDFTSLSFTQIIHALDAIADQLSQLSAFSFLDEPLPFVNLSVNDMINYAEKFAELIDGASGAGSQSSLQATITELEHQIEVLFDLDPDILTISLDDGGLSGLSGFATGGVNGAMASTVTLNASGNNNALLISTKPANLGTAASYNGSLVRFVADPTITGTTAQAQWDATNKILTVRINSGHTTANAIMSAVNGLAGSPWSASLASADPGNTGAGAVVTSSFVTTGGVNNSSQSAVTLMPGGDNNNFTISTADLATAATFNGSSVRMFGDAAVSGNNAQVSWDDSTNVLTLRINPGVTTANTVIDAINTAGIPWNAALAPPDNGASGNTGDGAITTTALKFSFVFQTAYANSLPFQLDLQELLTNLAGDNAAVRAFLEAATTLVQLRGSGNLTVSASALLSLDIGLDLSNPSTVKPFLYDTTGVVLTAKVLGTNLEIEASLGAVFGIFIKDGKVTLDHDGDPTTGAAQGDQGAIFRLGLKDNNGDGRHYFDESFFNSDNIDLTLEGGVSAQLPVFAPTESSPLSGDSDTNGDGYPDNYLVIEIPDVMRLFISEAVSTEADGAAKVVKFGGLNNDLNIVSDLYTNYHIVFLDTLSGNVANASFDAGTNTLTVNIAAGTTTALVARNAIQAATGGGGHFASTALTSDDDGNPSTTTNDGSGPLEKLSIVTPDFSQLFADLDLCSIITEHLGDILNGLDALLGRIEDGLNAIVYNTKLPLIGSGLQGAANFIDDFRSGLLKSLRDEVNAAGGNGATAVENAIKKALWNTLGPGGLDLLVDYATGNPLDEAAGFSQLDVTLDCDTGLIVNIRLKKDLALLDTTQNPIDFDIGVPGFGLEVDGNVVVSIGFDLKFGFGFNVEDGFYFNTSAPASDPELTIEFRAEIPGLHAAGQLLFLQLDVMDDADSPSLFRGFFEVDLMDPNHDGKLTFAEITSGGTQFSDVLHANLGAEAHINLDLAASFGGDAAFPRVLAKFHLDWIFDLDHGAGTPQISVTDIYLDLGTFISQFLAPILDKIQDVTKPLQPIVDLVTARIPILSDLAGEKITLLTLAEIFGLLEPSTVDFIDDVLQIITLINSLEGLGEGSILIPFGAFSLTADESGNMTNIEALQNAASMTMDEVGNAIQNYDDPGASSTFKSASAGFVSDAGSLHNFSIPIFDNPGELFNLFIGEPVRLIEWRMPTFKFTFTYTQRIPIYPPLYAQFGGTIGAEINIGFGYDTYGIQKFISSEDKNPIDILDGFYVLDFDAQGHERPELSLTGEIFAGASISLLIVEVGVQGGVKVTFDFDLNDVNDDGKVRVSEIVANAQQDPRCIFDITGSISLFLEAYLKVDLFFFSINKTWRFAEITLLEFHITCPEPVLASFDANHDGSESMAEITNGELFLNAGSRAADREEIDTNDNSERFIIKHTGGSASSETVEVEWGNFKQTFTGVKKITLLDAGEGDDYIDARGVMAPVEIHGGNGNDMIFLSDGSGSTAYGDAGNDTITPSSQDSATNVVLYGGDGNDILIAGTVAIEIHGGDGKDTITGSPQADTLYGDGGDDTITGNDGDDFIDAGAGNDIVDGNGGRDFILGGAGTDSLRGSRDDDFIDGGDGDDQIYGSAGNDLLIGGNGNDKLFGHGGIELLIGDQVGTINNIVIDYNHLNDLLAAVAAIPTSGITVKNLTGTGNDFLVGGGNTDALFGGDGNDTMYGGNFLSTGDTEVIEEDGNDFFDGGRGNDTILGDDSMGREGERNTGISINSAVWFDANLNGVRDADETGFGGVTVTLYRQSDSQKIDSTTTDVDGSFVFNGLDPLNYYLTFSIPTGMTLVTQYADGATAPEDSPVDNDAAPVSAVLGKTDQFNVTYGETEASVSAGYTGDAKVSITDQSVNEGSGGQTAVNFTVTLSHLQGFPVEIEYATADGTATVASGDYEAVPNTVLNFAPGETSKTITVFVNGDTMYEPHEQFQLAVVRAERIDPGGPVSLDVNHTPALVTIVNDDPVPTISIQDFRQVGVDDDNDPLTPNIYNEGMPAHFVVTLSNPSQYTVSVQWRTDAATTFQGANPDDAATPSGFPGADFTMAQGTLIFQPGETTKAFDVAVINDSLDENEESFFVDLYSPTFAEIADGRAYGLIADDDNPVSAYIVPVAPIGGPFTTEVMEGNGGTTPVAFWVRLSGASGKTVTVTYATSPGTAVESAYPLGVAPVDYVATPNDTTLPELTNLVFQPGETQKLITVLVNGDTMVEGEPDPDNPAHMIETFFVNILSADNADIAANPSAGQNNHDTVKIVDDDLITTDAGPWSVYFESTSYTFQEPTGGDDTAYITIRRTPGSSEPVAVFYTTNGTATAGADYDAVFRYVVYFEGDEISKTVPITVHSDNTVEGTETVNLWLRNPTGGPVRASPDRAVLRIVDGNTPQLEFDTTSLSVDEGSGGGTATQNVNVELHDPLTGDPILPGDQQSIITVTYKIVDLTALQPSDYDYAPGFPMVGTLTFNPGQVTRSIQVNIVKDNTPELTEKFAIQLSNPGGATIAEHNDAAFVTINDDDLTPIIGTVFYDANGNGFKDLNEHGIKDVGVTVTYLDHNSPVVAPGSPTDANGLYVRLVLLGQVSVTVDGASVTSPAQDLGLIIPFIGSGDYQTTTNNETQTVQFKGIVGISPFGDVGYRNTFTFDRPSGTSDSGRGGTDDTIYGGPGNDNIDAGAGDDHVVGGHWMTATDENAPINYGDDGMASYNAVIEVVTSNLHPVYDDGPIFQVNTTSPDAGIDASGIISGQVWIDKNSNSQQDGAGEIFGELVFVNLYDCDGNPIDTVVTDPATGAYSFTGLYLKDDGSDSEYVVEFVLPHDYTFISYVPRPESIDSDVVVGGRTTKIALNNSMPGTTDQALDQDAGVKGSNLARFQVTGGFRFGEPSYSVAESVKNGVVTVTVVRTNSFMPRAVVVKTFDGTALDGVNYTGVTALLFFDVGETVKTVDIPIINTESIGICTDPLTFNLELRDVTGRPFDQAAVYIGGASFANNPDDDTIQGGPDWDILIGDSGAIPAVTVIDPNPPYNNLGGIIYSGGPGKDVINGGDGPDYINGQHFDDVIAGNGGEDQVEAGFGNDTVIVELDDDTIDGGYGDDTVISTRDVARIDLIGTTASAILQHLNSAGDPLSTFTLTSVEAARIFGGGMRNTITIQDWDGAAYISGGGNTDSLSVQIDTDMILRDATFLEKALFLFLFGFSKDASLSQVDGATFHLSSLEKITIAGGASPNVIDAHGYTRPVTLAGLGGDDTLIGGPANDTFVFDADGPLGTDTITGNGGQDVLDFSSTSTAVTVDLADHASQTVVPGNLSLVLVDDIENVTGGSGNDFLYGNALNNVLLGGAGDDWLQGRGGNETYAYNADLAVFEHDTVVEDAGGGNDTLDFSATLSTVVNVNISITGAQNITPFLTLTIQDSGGGEAEIENIVGGAQADIIRGNHFDNILHGGPGNDILDGKSGDDVLDGGPGNDDLNGGDGLFDTINETANTNFTLTNSSLVRSNGEVDALNNIEVANLTGGAGNNIFTLTGWTGSGTVNGGGGTDALVWAADANFTLTDVSLMVTPVSGPISNFVLGSVETAFLTGGPGDNALNASAFTGNTVLTGGEGTDSLTGGRGLDVLRGGPGNDTLKGNRGNDVIDGGTGNDTLIEDLGAASWEVDFVITNNLLVIVQNDPNPAPPDDTITESDLLADIEIAILNGSPQDDTFDVSGWSAGALTVNGQGETVGDIVKSTAPGEGTLTLANTGITFTDIHGTSSASLAFSSIEVVYLYGSNGDDVIDATQYTGSAALIGNSGNDVLMGGPGLNLLNGGPGDDLFLFQPDGSADTNFVIAGDGTDTLDFSAFNAPVSINLSTLGALQNVVVGELQIYITTESGPLVEEIENVVGGSGADTLTGNALDNRITGGSGADTINGMGGTNTLVESADTNFTLTNTTLTDGGGNVDNLSNLQRAELSGGPGANTFDASAFTLGSVTLTGGNGDDLLIGGSGNDILIGGGGNDTLRGTTGSDIYQFDVDEALGEDIVDELSGAANGSDLLDFRETTTAGVTIDLSLTTQQTVAANLKLTLTSGSSIEYVLGGDQADTITGNSLDNGFIGGRGADIIQGGGGNNFLVESRDADFLLASTSATEATLTITDASGSETDSLTDIQLVSLTGGAGNNLMDATAFTGAVTLSGLGGDDELYGGNGDDTLLGGDGEDLLRGNGGDDDLRGGNDSDVYVFDQSFQQGSDTITESVGQGPHDTLLGVGIAGVDVDLYLTTAQVISLNLTLTLNYPTAADLGQVEHSY